MTSAAKPPHRDRFSFPLPAKGGGPFRTFAGWIARRLAREAAKLWNEHPEQVAAAIARLEASWALVRSRDTALLLVALYDRANRHDDMLRVLRQAFALDPSDPAIRLQAASAVLRHGTPADIDAFFASVLAVDPGDAFALFVTDILRRYDGWVAGLVTAFEADGDSGADARQPFVFCCPVWGTAFAENFARFGLASLLAPGNLEALSRYHASHVVIFTDRPTEEMLRRLPLFARLEAHARVHFVHYETQHIDYAGRMAAYYGGQGYPHSDETLDAFYARNCKFILMSCAHYVTLLAGRRVDALVSCGVADTTMSDGTLPRIAEFLRDRADAVLLHMIQLPGRHIRGALDADCRRPDGSVVLARVQAERLLVKHIPERNFHGSEHPFDMPLRLCWRVGHDGVIVHGNHFHPIGLRPARFDHPLRLTIDPVDSRFIDRTSLAADRIHLVRDGSILCLSVDDDPLFEGGSRPREPLSTADVALWLWGYWGRLRGWLFEASIRYGTAASEEAWRRVEASAGDVVADIVARADALDATAGRSWGAGAGKPGGCSSEAVVPEVPERVRK